MSEKIRCPSCNRVIGAHDVPLGVCPHCSTNLSKEVRQFTLRPKRPALLSLQIILGYVLGSFVLVSVLGIFDPAVARNFYLRGRPMTQGEFALFQIITSFVPAVALIWSSAALKHHRADARKWLFLAVFLFFIGSAITSQIQIPSLYKEIPLELQPKVALMSVALSFLMLLFAYWYLYKNRKVTHYFSLLEAIEQQDRTSRNT